VRFFRHPARLIVTAFVLASFAGALLLVLPFANEGAGRATFLTALFTATSAICVTGLVVVDTAGAWSGFGEAVILLLIQVGGFGIMTLSSLVLLFLARRLGIRQRLVAAAETGTLDVGEVRRVLVGVAKYSLAFEAVAALLLFLRFWSHYDEPFLRALYLGGFHAISAFNNAGFGLYADSLVRFNGDLLVLGVVVAALIAGGLGFPVWLELRRELRQPHRWSLHVKLTLMATAALLTTGWALFAWFEWTNPGTLGEMDTLQSLANAFFHAATPRTAGFNSIAMEQLRDPTRLLTEILMFIGGGSGSTAGGIKVTTFALLGYVMWAEVRGDPDVVAFERRVEEPAQRQALSVALLAIGVVMVGTMAMMAVSGLPRADVLFEVVSALGTVGLSVGATSELGAVSQVFVIALMLIGRVGPITLFAALVLRERDRLYRYPEERPIIG
jgi:trk system potassium uptake protein TrkH